MVTPDALFEKILTTEILLAMDGIIPSFSELKFRLTTTLDQLCHSLIAAGAPEEDVDRLCKIICICIDMRARTLLARQTLSWEGNELTHHYYGYQNEPVAIAETLEKLLRQPACHLDQYAQQLLFLLRPLFPTDCDLQALWFNRETVIPHAIAGNSTASFDLPPSGGWLHRSRTLFFSVILFMAVLSGLWLWCAHVLSEQY
ncbi:DotU family type IV/VI secretion system protein [Cronobacter malonaticus]|uniref:DotU family type IV/VI secretion system protein n=1 Tax=Cronobacter malonaticus TaxID=413503 RepID=UPI000949079A|nr:DotU family type IV/VI secretion system protein [Cronobacter malonaticus]EGT4445747.1 hypothetical protein [Cronobacter malonaticus]EKP4391882.1 DotU family type IV/VI secretion system protein [Cronobacter malonaticus]ELY2514236.1 DotU family type IV/VI secretion system protein [Cronobacter malonaticus]ELY4583148.1 DotU family type IV/VI secretion system protein [Cronobacter malonaticus]ELY5935124.1 DotU family type IV/VI secretion system protein [Cronobacter malonaticus]